MISISTIVSDTNGNVIIKKHYGSKLKEKPVRISRTKTLDGGVYIKHGGFSHGDRTLYIQGFITEDQESTINYMFENYTAFLISMRDGLFYCSVASFTAENGVLDLTIYIESEEN